MEEAPRFAVGGVISAGLSVVFANILRFLVIILAIGVPAVVLIVGCAAATMAGGFSQGDGFNFALNGSEVLTFLIFVVIAFISLVAYLLIQAALAFGALQHLRGGPVSIGACLSNGLAALPRVVLASLVLAVVGGLIGIVVALILSVVMSALGLFGLIVGIGAVVLFLFAITMIWVFVPAIVVERAGALACFGRSMELTRGRRWQIFAILVLLTIANWVVSFISNALANVAPVVSGTVDVVSGLFFLALGSVMAAVGYYYLRAEKEGLGIDDIAAVFD